MKKVAISPQEKTKGDSPMQEIIERLRTQKKASESEYKQAGRMDGAAWAKRADYTELKYAGEIYSLADGLHTASVLGDEILGEYWSERFRSDPVLNANPDEFINDEAEAWLTGWFGATEEFWAEVSAKL